MLRLHRLAFLFCALQACASNDDGAHAVPESSTRLSSASIEDLQSTIDGVVAEKVAPGVSLRVERPGYEAWQGTSGVADIETAAPITSADRFRAGSILKMAIATVSLQLVEQGKLSLDAALTELLPKSFTDRVPNAGAITLRMLLDHTSGVADFVDESFVAAVAADPTHVWTIDEKLDHVATLKPTFAPGAGWSYSNTNYLIAGQIIEGATGEPWRKTVRERVFLRAGMTESALPEEGNPLCDGCARGYQPIEDALVDITEVDPSMAGAAGGDALVTTARDLAKLLRAVTTGKLFRDAGSFELMRDFVDAPVPEWAQTGYGFGFARYELEGSEFVGLYGGTAGFHAFTLSEPSSGTIVSGFMNVDGDFGAFVLPSIAAVGRVLGNE